MFQNHLFEIIWLYIYIYIYENRYGSKSDGMNIFKYFSTCQTRSYDLWIMNAMCTFVYLFVVYLSFAPVISASIHRYVNYFDIQVLMMVTETKMLTSTLHHNKFTYLDYVFLQPSHTHTHTYIYIYIYIYTQIDVLIETGWKRKKEADWHCWK